jgi:hypothetical protein
MFDAALKLSPGAFTEIDGRPEPDRSVPPAGPAQLFHVARDPFEELDLAAAEPGRVARMTTQLESWFEEVEADRARAVVR